MASKYFRKALANTSAESRIFVKKNLDIVEQIHQILVYQEKTQKDLAQALVKSEAEVSRMLSGLHNLTLKTLAKLEAALGEDIIITPKKAREKPESHRKTKIISFKSENFQGSVKGRLVVHKDETQTMTAYAEETTRVRIPRVSVKWDTDTSQKAG